MTRLLTSARALVRALFAFVVLVLFLQGLAWAQEAKPNTATASTGGDCPTDDSVQAANCADAELSITFAGMVQMTGETPTEVKPTAFLEGTVPFPWGAHYPGRIFGRLGVATSPGQALTSLDVLASPQNWQSIEGGLGILRVMGVTKGGIVKSAILLELGFKTRRPADPLKPVQGATFYWLAGFRFTHADGHALTIGAGQDGELGDTGAVQVMVYGNLVLPKTAGIGSLVGDASFSFFAPAPVVLAPGVVPATVLPPLPLPGGAIRGSIIQVGLAADLAQAVAALKASKSGSASLGPAPALRTADGSFGPPAPRGRW